MFIAVLHTKCRARSRTRSRIARSALPLPQLAEFFRAIPSSTSGVVIPPRSSAVSGSIVEVRPGGSAFQIGTCPGSRQWIELCLRCARTYVAVTTSDFTVLFRARHGAGGATSTRAGYQGFARRIFEHAKPLVPSSDSSLQPFGKQTLVIRHFRLLWLVLLVLSSGRRSVQVGTPDIAQRSRSFDK